MDEYICPFLKKECIKNKCALWAQESWDYSRRGCSISIIASIKMNEEMQRR